MAYGARLESVLGASPRGFESPILRDVMSRVIVPMVARDFLLCGTLRVWVADINAFSGLGRRYHHRSPLCGRIIGDICRHRQP